MRYIYKWCGKEYWVIADTEHDAYIYLINHIINEIDEVKFIEEIDESIIEELVKKD